MKRYDIHAQLSITETDESTFQNVFEAHGDEAFSSMVLFDCPEIQYPGILAAQKALRENSLGLWRKFFLLEWEGSPVGWTALRQTDKDTVYMENTGIFPEYRRRGIYSDYLGFILPYLQREGFQIIFSRHVATYNAVIIPKLKAGFVIASLEISAQFGALVHLRYHCVPDQRRVFQFRAGLERMPRRLEPYINLWEDRSE